MRKFKVKDPNAREEAEKYDRPIPSRDAILSVLKAANNPLKIEHLMPELGLKKQDREPLRRRLKAMVRDGQVIRNRRGGYGVTERMDLVKGTIIGHPDGFGFHNPDAGGEDIYLPPRQMRQVLHGDRALVAISGLDRRGRAEGVIVEVLERAHTTLVGRYFSEGGIGFVTPDDKRIHQDVLIPAGQQGNAADGQFVEVAIDQQPNEHRQPMGHVIQELGSELDGRMCIELAIRSHGLPNVWPDAVSQEAAAIPDSVSRKDRKNRRDIRDLPLVTIDGASAKDFDDAVFCEPKDDGFRLLVAIADVSHYVTPGSALDTEAVERGTSAYFPGRVVPMLPTVLSNGICSLNPKVDRLCLVCDMHITADGKTRSSQFYPAVMHSHARLTYNQVWRAIGKGNKVARQQVGDLLPQLEHLFACYRALAGQRRRRGALEFDRVEPQLVLDGNGNVTDIKVEPRNDAHRLIEECMVAANVAAAKFIGRRKWPGPYRVHEAPQSTKLDDLMTFLHARGLSFPAKAKKIRPEHFAQILKTAKGRDDEALIQAVLLRSQSMAVYQPENNGHFGLALSHYAHFTSPIRRYPDLILHRLIKQGLNKSTPRMTERQMQNLCARCSTNERRAEDASRDATSRLQCLYLKRHIGDVFSGTITGVKGFGVFVELDEVYTSGLVHVTALPADYYHFDGNRHELVGEKRGKRFRLADRVRVEVLNVDVEESKVDLKIAK